MIPGYRIDEIIHEGKNTLIFRGMREIDGEPVVLKLLNSEYPTPEELARFKMEYAMTRDLQIDGVVRALDFETSGKRAVLVLKDINGESLSKLMEAQTEKMSLEQCLKLGIRIANIVDQIHARKIIHKDINPTNIIWNPDIDQVEFIDFGISTELSREVRNPVNPEVMEGTLTHISPEQTGRMNRSADYRTDLYSLGVTLYELFTRSLPFAATDPMELVHCHIARMPAPPHEIDPGIPRVISGIIMKLMSKMAEDRYRSASGVAADLGTCLETVLATGHIDDFPIGRQDVYGQFLMPQKLYGRTKDISKLTQAFSRVEQGGTELMMVAGYSGVGKSSLVKEMYRPVAEKRGYFISGKFDQFQQEIPYYSILQAVKKLVEYLLGENDDQLAVWRNRLEKNLGDEARVLTEVLPELEHIIGPQPPVAKMSGTEAQKRFNKVFNRFLQIFCNESHPLVLFLDDLQWADPASLGLIKSLMTRRSKGYLMVLGAYRDNEVSPAHPLMLTLDEIRQNKPVDTLFSTLTLGPLSLSDTTELVGDAIGGRGQEIACLAELLQQKTDGNPFFLLRLLVRLHEDGLLYYSSSDRGWRWNMESITALGISDNVADLLVRKIEILPDKTRELLVVASCLGNRFDLGTLAIISQASFVEIAKGLWDAVKEELVIPQGDACTYGRWGESDGTDPENTWYKFFHDRVQEAAYSGLSHEKRSDVHLKAGRLLLENTSQDKLDERLFEIVNHLNFSVHKITDRKERRGLAALNLSAAQKAKAATAYDAAHKYVGQGMDLLSDNGWEEDYNTLFALCRERIELEFLCGSLDQAEEVFELAKTNSRSRHDSGELYELMIRICHINYNYDRGIELGKQGLALFGFDIPDDPDAHGTATQNILAEISQYAENESDILELENGPAMEDKDAIVCCGMLHGLWVCMFMTANEQMLLPALMMIKLSVTRGQSAVTAVGHIFYAIVMSNTKDYDRAYAFGRLAMRLVDKYLDPLLAPKVLNTYCNFVNHYKNHVKTNIPIYEQSYKYCVQSGEIWWGAWAASFIRTARLIKGDPLPKVLRTTRTYESYIREAEFAPLVLIMEAQKAKLTHLMDKTGTRTSLDTDEFNEAECVKTMESMPFDVGLFWHYIYKTFVFFIYGEMELALEAALKAEKYRSYTFSLMMYPDHFFFTFLVLAGSWPRFNQEQKKEYKAVMDECLENMENWANHCPDNYSHRLCLMKAENARLAGDDQSAMAFYDKAVENAEQNQYLHHAAMANELAGQYFLEKGRKRAARGYLIEARHGYLHWGAKRKVRYFDEIYPGTALTADDIQVRETIMTTNRSQALDLISVMKAAQAISGEIVLEKLLKTLMFILMENAGAQRGVLVLSSNDMLWLAAEGDMENNESQIFQSRLISEVPEDEIFCSAVVNFAARTRENVVLSDAVNEGGFIRDPYVVRHKPRSILCTPLLNKTKLDGLIYLENNLISDAFTPDRIEALILLSIQAAISIENASLYNTLEQKVAERTAELQAEVFERKRAEAALKVANRELHELASLDGLTQIANRRYFDEFLASEWKRGQRENRPISVILCDIDYFKNYNDAYGHQAGDDCLKKVARTMKETLKRPGDLAARYGGEEFVMVLSNSGIEGARHIAFNLQSKIKDLSIAHHASQVGDIITLSMGIASVVPGKQLNVKAFIRLADRALYRAKEKGRNRIEVAE